MRVFSALIAWLFLLGLACVATGLVPGDVADWLQSIAVTVTAGAAFAGVTVAIREAGPFRRPTLVMLTAGLGYLWLALGPVASDTVGPRLVTTKLLEIYATGVLKLPPPTAVGTGTPASIPVYSGYTGVGNQPWVSTPNVLVLRPGPLGPFRLLGHLWFGWFTAVVAMWAVARLSEPSVREAA